MRRNLQNNGGVHLKFIYKKSSAYAAELGISELNKNEVAQVIIRVLCLKNVLKRRR